jgi:transposase
MEKAFLEGCLTEGISLDAIGERAERHPSTVSYWLKKHRLRADGSETHSPKGRIDETSLRALVEQDLSLREMAERLDRSATVVRYWLDKYDIQRWRHVSRVIPDGPKKAAMSCRRHGLTEFVLEGRGSYRCGRCRVEAVARRRRVVKRVLVEEAGGSCIVCGYSRCQQALQFHHVDPATKRFHLGQSGHS